MKTAEEHKYEDARLRELFHALPAEDMPQRLQSKILQQAAMRHESQRARLSDRRGMAWAGLAVAGIVGVAIFLFSHLGVKVSIPKVDIAGALSMPQVQADPTTPIWLIAAAGALALLMIDTLIRRHLRKKEHKTDL